VSQYRRILLIADPAMKRTPAFERAVWLARTCGAALHIALFDRNSVIKGAALIDRDAAVEARRIWMLEREHWLRVETATLQAGGVVVTSEVVWARPVADDILNVAADQQADLVVKDVHLEGVLQRVLLTPLDWQLLRQCAVPLMLVNSLGHALPRRIVAAVDASHDYKAGDLNDRVIQEALRLAIPCDAELHLIHAFSGPQQLIDPNGAGVGSIGELERILLPVHQRNFAAIADAHSVPADRRHFLRGTPVRVISDFARQRHSDVIVIGSVRHNFIDRLIMGTTAEALLDQAPCNLLAVKP